MPKVSKKVLKWSPKVPKITQKWRQIYPELEQLHNKTPKKTWKEIQRQNAPTASKGTLKGDKPKGG